MAKAKQSKTLCPGVESKHEIMASGRPVGAACCAGIRVVVTAVVFTLAFTDGMNICTCALYVILCLMLYVMLCCALTVSITPTETKHARANDSSAHRAALTLLGLRKKTLTKQESLATSRIHVVCADMAMTSLARMHTHPSVLSRES